MAGIDTDIQGEARPMPGLNIGYLPQEPQLDPEKTVRQEVESGLGEAFEAQAKLEAVYAAYADEDADFDALAKEQERLESIIAAADGGNLNLQLEMAADALRLPPWDAKIGVLSGGEKRRVALCKLLLSKPDMLLLDEPTNHLDAESVEWLEQFLLRFPGTVVGITHDRYFLDNAAEWILELDRGHGIPWKGNYSSWLDQKQARLKQEESTESARQKALQKELEWSRQNPKARQAKSKARLARFNELSEYEYQKRNETQEIFIPVAERLGNEVIEFKNVSKAFGDRLLIDNLSFTVPPGAIVGIIGPNGAGKSTLFKMIAGKEQPDSGEVVIGQTARSRWSTSTATSWPTTRPCSKTSPAAPTCSASAASRCRRAPTWAASTSRAADQQKMVGNLSGGERGRLHLAKTLLQGRQRPAAGRTVERPGRRNPARAGRCAAGIRRQRDGDLARSLVPGPYRDAHPGLRRQLASHLLRRQLPGIRSRQEEAPGRRRREAEAYPLQAADRVIVVMQNKTPKAGDGFRGFCFRLMTSD
jgi:sulfate-transporting ATPase